MASASSILLDEHFQAGDDRFLDEVFASTAAKKLKALAPRWFADARPFARAALLRYVDDGCNRPHHRPLVKALFKLAEKAGDDEAMAGDNEQAGDEASGEQTGESRQPWWHHGGGWHHHGWGGWHHHWWGGWHHHGWHHHYWDPWWHQGWHHHW